MDLFELFDAPEDKAPEKARKELVDELDIIIQKHGINVPVEVLEDLASYYDDPPPWAPWVK
jgi:hypothetical protein